jgi:hypothetical protein
LNFVRPIIFDPRLVRPEVALLRPVNLEDGGDGEVGVGLDGVTVDGSLRQLLIGVAVVDAAVPADQHLWPRWCCGRNCRGVLLRLGRYWSCKITPFDKTVFIVSIISAFCMDSRERLINLQKN